MRPAEINIVAAQHVGDYSLLLMFDDKSEQIINFEPLLACSSHPDMRVWLELDKFSAFRIECGDLIWGNHDLSFPAVDLYLMAWSIGARCGL